MTLVLNYGPKPAHDHDRMDRVYLAWPSLAWRVVAPLPMERRINILQKAVLGICRSASYPAAEIAAKLHLHPRLIEVIAMELIRSGWVNQAHMRPTEKGLAMLEQGETAADSLVSGWVFQDPWTGDLWPFFAHQFQLQEASPTPERTRLALLFNTSKGTRRTYAWTLDAPQTTGQPTTEAILEAVRRFRRREKLKGSMRLLDSGLDEPVAEGISSSLSRISFIGDQPEPTGLVTYAYVPRGGGLEPQLCDPFGFGCAAPMWRQLERVAQLDEAASGAMREILRLANAQDAPALAEHLKWQRRTAEAYVIERLSLEIRTFPSVFEHIVEAQHAISLAIEIGNDPQGQLASSIQFCRKAYEAVLKEMLRRSSLGALDKLVTGNANQDQAKVEGIVAALGFTSPMPRGLRDSIKGEKSPDDIRKVLQRITKDLDHAHQLKGMIIALVVAAEQDGGHPLRKAAKRAPDLLAKCMDVTSLGNPASHDTIRRFAICDAANTRDLTLEVTACLLDLPFK